MSKVNSTSSNPLGPDFRLFVLDKDFDRDPETRELIRFVKRSGLPVEIYRVTDKNLPFIQRDYGIYSFPAIYDTINKVSYSGLKVIEYVVWSKIQKIQKGIIVLEDLICYIIRKLFLSGVTATEGVISKILFFLSLELKLPCIPSIARYGPYLRYLPKALALLKDLGVIEEFQRKKQRAYKPLVTEKEFRVLENRLRRFAVDTTELDRAIEIHKGWTKERIGSFGKKQLKILFTKMKDVPWEIDTKRVGEFIPNEIIEEIGISVELAAKMLLGEVSGKISAYRKVYLRERIKQKLLERCRKIIRSKDKGKEIQPWRYGVERLAREIRSGRNIQGEFVFLLGFPFSFLTDEEDLCFSLADSLEMEPHVRVRIGRNNKLSEDKLSGYIIAVLGFVEEDYVRATAVVRLNYVPEWFEVNCFHSN